MSNTESSHPCQSSGLSSTCDHIQNDGKESIKMFVQRLIREIRGLLISSSSTTRGLTTSGLESGTIRGKLFDLEKFITLADGRVGYFPCWKISELCVFLSKFMPDGSNHRDDVTVISSTQIWSERYPDISSGHSWNINFHESTTMIIFMFRLLKGIDFNNVPDWIGLCTFPVINRNRLGSSSIGPTIETVVGMVVCGKLLPLQSHFESLSFKEKYNVLLQGISILAKLCCSRIQHNDFCIQRLMFDGSKIMIVNFTHSILWHPCGRHVAVGKMYSPASENHLLRLLDHFRPEWDLLCYLSSSMNYFVDNSDSSKIVDESELYPDFSRLMTLFLGRPVNCVNDFHSHTSCYPTSKSNLVDWLTITKPNLLNAEQLCVRIDK